MNILIYCSHPAQFLFYKFTIRKLINDNHRVKLLIKSKDVLEQLVQAEGVEYENILIEGRRNSKVGIIVGLAKRLLRINRIIRKFKPDILLGTDASIAQLAWLHRKTGIITLEDDAEVIPQLARLTYPFAKHIIVPAVCSVGKWHKKKIGYQAYMKLAYLHPNYFKPDSSKIRSISTPFYLIRLSQLNAHHDFGIKGIDLNLLDSIINKLKVHGRVFISSEKELPTAYSEYKLIIAPEDIHHYLSFADLLICDSQSMAMEAAMLGTASIRFSSFAGRISVLEELEQKYGLTFGVKPEFPEKLMAQICEILEIKDIKREFLERKQKMLNDKIDVTAFIVWFIENYPSSYSTLKSNSDFQFTFR